MKNSQFQKFGGIAALISAATFVFAIVLMITVVAPSGYGSLDISPDENAAFLANNQALMYSWNLVGYVIFGIFLVILTLALHDRLKVHSPAIMQIATAFGLIWAGLMFASGMVANIGAGIVTDLFQNVPSLAVSTWLSLHFVVDGLGGGNEIVGGLWVLLVSIAGIKSDGLPKLLNYFGIIVAVAGLTTVIPALGEVGAIFGLGSILWFIWLGVVMLRSKLFAKSENAVTIPASA